MKSRADTVTYLDEFMTRLQRVLSVTELTSFSDLIFSLNLVELRRAYCQGLTSAKQSEYLAINLTIDLYNNNLPSNAFT